MDNNKFLDLDDPDSRTMGPYLQKIHQNPFIIYWDTLQNILRTIC